ncbi:hypothetical protein ACFLXB_06500 [Chloroflexota bacterium]
MNERREFVFGLEKDLSKRRINRIITFMVLIALLLIGEFSLVTFVAPSLPSSTQLLTQTINPLITPQFFPLQSTSGTQIVDQPIGSIPENCIIGQVLISEPVPDQEIRGEIVIKGTADIPNFGFYKYEYSPLGAENWTTILAGREPVIDGELGNWDTSELTSGDYQLRLVVFDNVNSEYPACSITIRVNN